MDTPEHGKRKLDQNILRKLNHDVPTKDPTRENFLKRLNTFDVLNWSGKPINPPECARLGWELAEKDVLKCTLCHQFVSVTLPSPSKFESYKEACTKLKTRLASSHSKFCLFTSSPLSESVLEIGHLSNGELLDSVKGSLAEFGDLNAEIEVHRKPEIQEIFSWFLQQTLLAEEAHRLSCFFLVLTGWQFFKEETAVKCAYCNRKWGLERIDGVVSPADLSCATVERKKPIDPVAQHQMWCAWRAPTVGWESRLAQLQRVKESRDRNKRTRLQSPAYASLAEGMRNVRKMLNGTL